MNPANCSASFGWKQSVQPPALATEGGALVRLGSRVLWVNETVAYLYEIGSGRWSEVAEPPTDEGAPTALIQLATGNALLISQINGVWSSAEYDAESDEWTVGIPTGQSDEALLSNFGDGAILAGGRTRALDEVHIYREGEWLSPYFLAVGRFDHGLQVVSKNEVLVVGGRDENGILLASAEILTPEGSVNTGGLVSARADFGTHLLADGRILIAGGEVDTEGATASVEGFDAQSGRFSELRPVSSPRSGGSTFTLNDGRVLLTGGVGDDPISDELFVLRTGFWELVSSESRLAPGLEVGLGNGAVLRLGMRDGVGSSELFCPPRLPRL